MDLRHKLIIPVANLITGICGIYLSMYQISVLRIAEIFGLSKFMMSVIVAMQFVGILLPPLFLGTLSEKIGKRGVVMISLPLAVLGALLISVTNNITLFIAGVIMIGAGFSVTEGTVSAIIGTEFPDRSTFHLGVTQASFSLGAVLSPIACEALFAAGYEYNEIFGMVSAAFLVLYVLFLLTKQKSDVKGSKEGIAGAFKFFTHSAFIYLAVAMVTYVGAEGVIAFFADSWFEKTLHAAELSAPALSLFWAGMIPTRLLLGAIKLRHKTTFIICAAGIVLCAAAVLIIPVPAARLAAYAGLGIFCGPCWPLIMDITAKKYPQSAGTVSNLMMSLGGFGGFALPLAAGALTVGADFRLVFVVAAACAAVMGAMFYLAGRRIKA